MLSCRKAASAEFASSIKSAFEPNPSVYCRSCTDRQAIERQQRLKQEIVVYFGGKCALCGYSRYIGSLELHHTNPDVKEFDFAHSRSTTFEKIKSELEKCILLCANCHREEHARLKWLL